MTTIISGATPPDVFYINAEQLADILNTGTLPSGSENAKIFRFNTNEDVNIIVDNVTTLGLNRRIIVIIGCISKSCKVNITFNANKTYLPCERSYLGSSTNAPCITLIAREDSNVNIFIKAYISFNNVVQFSNCNIYISHSNKTLTISGMVAIKCCVFINIEDKRYESVVDGNVATTTISNSVFFMCLLKFNKTYKITTVAYIVYFTKSLLIHCMLDMLYVRINSSPIINCLMNCSDNLDNNATLKAINTTIINTAFNGYIFVHSDTVDQDNPMNNLSLYNELGMFYHNKDIFYILSQSKVVATTVGNNTTLSYKVTEGLHNVNSTNYCGRTASGKYMSIPNDNMFINNDTVSQAVYVHGTPKYTHIGLVKCIKQDMPSPEHVLYGYEYGVGLQFVGKLVIPEEELVLKEFGEYGYQKEGKLDTSEYSKNIYIRQWKEEENGNG